MDNYKYTFHQYCSDIDWIVSSIRNDRWEFDYVVGLLRGGMIPAVDLSHRFKKPLLALNMSTRDNMSVNTASLYDIIELITNGSNVLIVDDIVDSGATMQQLVKKLMPVIVFKEQVKVAALVYNKALSFKIDYFAKTIDRTIDDRWIDFWWETPSYEDRI